MRQVRKWRSGALRILAEDELRREDGWQGCQGHGEEAD